MPRFIQSIPIGICDRCRMKFPHAALMRDGDIPALLVCSDCRDDIDPYKLPPHPVERIAVRYPRLDAALNITGDVLSTEQGPAFTVATEDGEDLEVQE